MSARSPPGVLLGYFTTALEPDELVTAVRFPAPVKRAAMQEFRAATATSRSRPSPSRYPRTVSRASYSAASAVPVRAREARQALAGGGRAEQAARAAAEEIDPATTRMPAPTTRRRLAATLVRRALEEANGS